MTNQEHTAAEKPTGDLPPLPAANIHASGDVFGSMTGYNANAMRDYARAAIASYLTRQEQAEPSLQIAGTVCEIGQLDGDHEHGVVLKRMGGFVTIKGLKIEEVSALGACFLSDMTVSFGGTKPALATPVSQAPVAHKPSAQQNLPHWALKELLGALPARRDWFNPDAEKILRAVADAGPVAPVAQATKQQVGCERDDGLLNIHAESETCEVCAPVAQAVPLGWKLVPVKPNADMLKAGAESEDKDFGLIIHNVYCAMLDAAPTITAASALTPHTADIEQMLDADEEASPTDSPLYREWSQIMDVLQCDDTESALAKIRASAQTAPGEVRDQWISIDERLPECSTVPDSLGVEVIVFPAPEDGESTAFFGCRVTDEPWFYKYGAVLCKITHWMPLPEAPGKGQTGAATQDTEGGDK